MKKFLSLASLLPMLLLADGGASFSIPVTHSEPIYRDIVTKVPHTECKDESVRVEVDCGGERVDRNALGFDTLLGVAAGVALGNQIGKDRTKDVARVIGGIGGGILANQIRKDNSQTCYTTRTQERCTTVYDERIEREVVAYRLCGEINGHKICTESPRKKEYIEVYASAN